MIRKTQFILFLILFLHQTVSQACTTFVLKHDNQLVFGRNLDWTSDNGIVVVNKRNVHKISIVFPPDKPFEWTSKYGSISFNQFGKEFPFGGINETGLVIEIMLAEAEYPNFDERSAVNELQWIQYHLDNSKTIDDVINSDAYLRIKHVSQELHFLISDKEGNAAVIEFKDHKMVVYRNNKLPYPVLENDPYEVSLKNYNDNYDCRFKKVVDMIKKYQPEKDSSIIDYSFEILSKVLLDGSWTVVYDIRNMKIYFKTTSNPKIRIIDFEKFNFDCKSENLIYDIQSKNKGNINKHFSKLNFDLNKEKILDAMSIIAQMPQDILDKYFVYYQSCECLK